MTGANYPSKINLAQGMGVALLEQSEKTLSSFYMYLILMGLD